MNAAKIGKKLAILRGDKSQMEVAEAVEISISALSMYERGERIPRDEIKVKLANFFNSTVQAIFFED